MPDRDSDSKRLLRKIDRNVASLRTDLERGLSGFDEEQEEQNEKLDKHARALADYDRRLRSLERKG